MENEVVTLYENLIDAWNDRNAGGIAEQFTDTGELIGFDGSHVIGRDEIYLHLDPIFKEHETPPFITKVKSVRPVGENAVILRSIVGMIPPGKSEIDPEFNAHQTLVAVKSEGNWRIELFQNTPAQFHGRPELVEQMTEELRVVID
ncbi:SgcJ/EcaC family oxidoreductase [Alkalihalobacillus sp. AL-G]|uniref:SgcJ/EcaC family oxidoreductase n=1 Tax=Alkalihalobacillus sp. AL-G TaxID=2926399 RepID=UPI002729834E|nr:SgcJ/EcaC family oxidoreductase [Alkalihalobacillus sp. AL-G]WLD93901.1 SgcJ/EcaC family oxidoreductase [Alkalihalobacillus sp. AL-G]